MKRRETVTAFDFANAFKALSELDIPKVNKKQSNLNEHFTRSNVTNVLMEDYYDVNDIDDLEQAQNDRQEEIAQAKLARIEKIVDIDAESPEDILPSYVGKHIIQCPQCMTLFYKDPEDIEISEEDETVCNDSEICQHCGNDSGYMLIGKVEAVDEVEADKYDAEDFDENELNLDFDGAEDNSEETVELEGEEDLAPEEVEEAEEEEVEEVKESLQLTESFEETKTNLKKAIGDAMKNSESDKAKIVNIIIDNVEEKDIEEVFSLIKAHAGRVNLTKEQTQKIIDKLPDDCKEKAKAEKWATIKNVCDFLDYTPEWSSNNTGLNILKIALSIIALSPIDDLADGGTPIFEIIVGIIDLIPNSIINKLITALSFIFNPALWIVKGGSLIAKKQIEKNVKQAGEKLDDLEEGLIGDTVRGAVRGFLGEEAQEDIEEGIIGNTIRGAVKGFLGEEKDAVEEGLIGDTIRGAARGFLGMNEEKTEEGLIGDTVRGAARGFLGMNEEKAEEGLIGDTIRGAARGLLLGEDQQENEVEEGLITDTIRGAVKGFLGEEAEEQLTEAVDKELDDKLKAHNDYIEYLKDEIEKSEKELENAKNEFVKKSIESRLDSLKADLEAALPEALKDEVQDELPAANEIEEVKESLTENLKEESAKELLQDFADSLGEELKETIEEDVETEEKLAEFEQKLEDLDKEDVEEDAKIQRDFVDDVSSEEFKDLVYNPIYQESLEDEFEELDECSLNEHISSYLSNVYENVKSFEATNCAFENNKLIVEGNINFNSGNVKNSKFEFIKENNSFVGKNSTLCEGLSFTLNYKVENKVIITESFKYKYNIGENLVEGIIKK